MVRASLWEVCVTEVGQDKTLVTCVLVCSRLTSDLDPVQIYSLPEMLLHKVVDESE